MSENQASTFGNFPHIKKTLLTALTNSAMIVNDKNYENIDLDEDNIKVWERSFLITHAEGFVNKGELHLVS